MANDEPEQQENTGPRPRMTSDNDFDSDPQMWDIVIVGAGVAGSALAYAQGKCGRRVLLLERDLTLPDRIVGELLQPGGYLMLKRLGLGDAVEGIDSQKMFGYALFMGEKDMVVKYPLEDFSDDVAGRCFHHGRFVQSMREAAAALPTVTVREGIGKKLINGDNEPCVDRETVCGVQYRDQNGKTRIANARLTIVCDGMYSSLRNTLHKEKVDIKHPSYFVGLKLKNVKLPYPNHGHVVLGKRSPVLFYPISSTEARCLVDMRFEKLPKKEDGDLSRYLRTMVAPEVPEALKEAFLTAVDEGDIRAVRNKQMTAKEISQRGALLLGDAFNMRHPLTGGGMTVALSDCKLLSDVLQPLPSLEDVVDVARRTSELFNARKPISGTINTLAGALYQVFCYEGEGIHEEMREACFDYLRMGGMYARGPVSLLSGLNPKPLVLVMHFFMVALYGVGRKLWPLTLSGAWIGLRLLTHAAGILLPILKAEGFNMFFSRLPSSLLEQ